MREWRREGSRKGHGVWSHLKLEKQLETWPMLSENGEENSLYPCSLYPHHHMDFFPIYLSYKNISIAFRNHCDPIWPDFNSHLFSNKVLFWGSMWMWFKGDTFQSSITTIWSRHSTLKYLPKNVHIRFIHEYHSSVIVIAPNWKQLRYPSRNE